MSWGLTRWWIVKGKKVGKGGNIFALCEVINFFWPGLLLPPVAKWAGHWESDLLGPGRLRWGVANLGRAPLYWTFLRASLVLGLFLHSGYQERSMLARICLCKKTSFFSKVYYGQSTASPRSLEYTFVILVCLLLFRNW